MILFDSFSLFLLVYLFVLLFLLFMLLLTSMSEYEPVESYVSLLNAYKLLPKKGNL